MAGLYPVSMEEANDLLILWEHELGPVKRPFHQEAFVYEVEGRPMAVATSGSIVNGPVAGYERQEVVELTRLAGANRWILRVMIRLYREVCAPRWSSWPVKAAVSYQLNSKTGNLYRFDGWERVRDDCGSSGGGSWSRKRYAIDAAHGPKTLWVWRYA
jgi:hypothetical protein